MPALRVCSVDQEDAEGGGTLVLAMTRVLGIAFGVLILELSAIVIFPKSASEEALRKLAICLGKLAELNRIAWAHGPLAQPAWRAAAKLDSTSRHSKGRCASLAMKL